MNPLKNSSPLLPLGSLVLAFGLSVSANANGPGSCVGRPYSQTELVSHFSPGTSRVHLASLRVSAISRTCQRLTGCSNWVATPVTFDYVRTPHYSYSYNSGFSGDAEPLSAPPPAIDANLDVDGGSLVLSLFQGYPVEGGARLIGSFAYSPNPANLTENFRLASLSTSRYFSAPLPRDAAPQCGDRAHASYCLTSYQYEGGSYRVAGATLENVSDIRLGDHCIDIVLGSGSAGDRVLVLSGTF